MTQTICVLQAVPAQMTVAELKAALSGLGLAVSGKKGALVSRLEEAQAPAAGLPAFRQASLV